MQRDRDVLGVSREVDERFAVQLVRRHVVSDRLLRLGGGRGDQCAQALEALAQAAVDNFGSLSIWVNNAGGSTYMGPLTGASPDAWQHCMEVNLTAVWAGTVAAVKRMEDGGAVINISSRAARGPVPGSGHYGAAKAAVAVTESIMRREGAGVAAKDGQLNGTALFVLDAADADVIVVSDETGRQHLVAPDAAGVELTPLPTIDKTRSVGELKLSGAAADLLPRSGIETTRRIIDAGRVMLAADTLGAGAAMIEQSVAYAGQRMQFGRPIGSFQAVKHMCAEMAAGLEPCRSLVWYAAHAFDEVPGESALMACHAKSHLSEVGRFVARTATEVHGGMGFTDLAGLHYWFKRIGLDRQLLGGPELVRNEAARLQGWIAA